MSFSTNVSCRIIDEIVSVADYLHRSLKTHKQTKLLIGELQRLFDFVLPFPFLLFTACHYCTRRRCLDDRRRWHFRRMMTSFWWPTKTAMPTRSTCQSMDGREKTPRLGGNIWIKCDFIILFCETCIPTHNSIVAICWRSMLYYLGKKFSDT